jgi:integrase
VRGKRGSGKGWSILKTKRDGRFVMKYRLDVIVGTERRAAWRQHRIPVAVQTRRDAEIYAVEFIKALPSSEHGPEVAAQPVAAAAEPPRDPVLGDFAERWLALRKGLVASRSIRPATHTQDAGTWRKHIQPALGNVPMSKLVEVTVIREFIRAKAAEKANFTVRNIASTLKTMLDDIDAEGWFVLPRNPMRHKKVVELLPPPRTKAGKKVIVHVVRDDAEKLLRSRDVESEHKVRYLVGLMTGLRDGELRGLQLADVHLEGGAPLLRVRRAVALKGFDGRNTVQEPKTEDAIRDVPLQPIVVEALRWWIQKGWVRWVGHRPKPTDFMFPNHEGKPCRPRSSQQLRDDLVRAGCSEQYEGNNVTMHALRRSFSTRLDEFPEAHRVKHDLMGHSAKGVDQIHYTATSQVTKRRAVDSIGLDVTLADITNDEVAAPATGDAPAPERP